MSPAWLAPRPSSSRQAVTNPSSPSCSDESSDGACDWLDELPSQGPVTLTPFDRQLWESLLDCDQQWRQRTSNGNNIQCRGATSEEPIPPSAAATEFVSAQPIGHVTQRRGQSTRTQSCSPSSTPCAVRVVNWAAEACDRRWGRVGADASTQGGFEPRVSNKGAHFKDQRGALRKRRVLTRRLPASGSLAANRRPKCFHRPPIRTGSVKGILSSVPDSLPLGREGDGNSRSVQSDPLACCPSRARSCPSNSEQHTLRSSIDIGALTSLNMELTRQVTSARRHRLLEIKKAAASSGSQEGSTYRIPTSDTSWLLSSKRKGAPVTSMEVTMEISGDSSSSDEAERSPATVRQVRRSPDRLPAHSHPPAVQSIRCSPVSLLPPAEPLKSSGWPLASSDRATLATIGTMGATLERFRRSVVISVSGSGGRRTAVAKSVLNSKTASTNTEQSASTALAGASEGQSVSSRSSACAVEAHTSRLRIGTRRIHGSGSADDSDSRATAVPIGVVALRSAHQADYDGGNPRRLSHPAEPNSAGFEWIRGSTGDASLRLMPHGPLTTQAPGCQPRLHAARVLLRHNAVSVAPVWFVHWGQQQGPFVVASLRQFPVDCERFVWQNTLPARCSRACCQLLPGPLDSSQLRETLLALHRCPVYSQHQAEFANTAISTVHRQVAPCVGVTAPVVDVALRYVEPSETADTPSSDLSSSETPSRSPFASPWWQQIRWPPQPTTAAGQHQLVPVSVPPARALIPQGAARSGSETTNPKSGRKAQQLRELRRIVRMKMERKVLENEFVSVPCCCCCSTLTSSAEAEDSSLRRQATTGLELRLGSLLEGLRSCRQTAAAAVNEQQSVEQRSGLVSFVERILSESCSQQAALKDLLTSLKGGGAQAEGKLEEFSAQTAATTASPGSTGSFQSSGQFFSLGTENTGPADVGTRASRPTADQFLSPDTQVSAAHNCQTPADRPGGIDMSENNNANDATAVEAAAATGTTATASDEGAAATGSGCGRHHTYYARRCIVHLEKSAAIVVHKPACRASSRVRQDRSAENSSCSSDVQAAASPAVGRRNPERLRALERRVLAQSWRRPPIPGRLLDQLDPLVASFIWWSLIPLGRRLHASQSGRSSQATPCGVQLERESSSSSVDRQTDGASVTIGHLMTISLPASD